MPALTKETKRTRKSPSQQLLPATNAPQSLGANELAGMVAPAPRALMAREPGEAALLESNKPAGPAPETEERKRNDEAARWLAAIVESSDEAIVGKDLNGVITSWNAGAERIFGYTAAEIVGRPVTILIPAERQAEEQVILERIRRGEKVDHFETIRQRKDGALLEISLTTSPIKDANGKIIGASKIARDVTKRKRVERQQSALYELVAAINRTTALPIIFDSALETICRCQNADRAAILLFDDSGVMRFKAWRGLSESYRHAVEGHSPWKHSDPDPQPVCIDDVSTIPLEEHLRSVISTEGIRALAFIPLTYQNCLLGKFMVYYDTVHHFTPEEIRPVQTIASQIVFALERQRSSEALERLINERTASLRDAISQMEEFSYSVSHDLRSPVRAMQGYARALSEDYGDRLDEQAREYLDRIIQGSSRMERLIHDVLTYSRAGRMDMQLHSVSLHSLLRGVLRQYPELDPSRADITIEPPLPCVLGHEPSLGQAIANLLNNAVKFVHPGTRAKVQIRAERNAGQVTLRIRDNGIGIKPQYQARLFGMFERVHPESKYEGTGIGLAIVRKTIERMGGKVGVESDGIHGSTFWIQLPEAP